MRTKTLLLGSLLALGTSLSAGALLYTDDYLPQSGITMAPVATHLPNRVDGRRLLHWHRTILRLSPIRFRNGHPDSASQASLDQLRRLIEQNRGKIRYVSLIGHSSAVTDDENRIALGGLAGLWQSLGNTETLSKAEAVSRVNRHLKAVYDRVEAAGMNPARIYSENRLDRQPIATEATAEGRRLNNRVDVALYATGPLSLADLRIQFALDSDRILPDYDSRVREFAELLKSNPSLRTTIIGHTDRQGGYGYNMALSKRRAEAVKARLVQLGVSADRIRTEGKGYTQPIAHGHSEAAYRQNRRIEAKIYR